MKSATHSMGGDRAQECFSKKSDIWFSQSSEIQKGGKKAFPGREKNKKKGLGAEYIQWLENS